MWRVRGLRGGRARICIQGTCHRDRSTCLLGPAAGPLLVRRLTRRMTLRVLSLPPTACHIECSSLLARPAQTGVFATRGRWSCRLCGEVPMIAMGGRTVRRLACAAGVTIVLVELLLAWPATAQTPGKWVKLAPFPEPGEELLGAAAGGKLYVFAGLAPGWKPRGLVYEYDPATNTWRPRSPMPTARNHAAPGVVDGKLYVIGGRVGAAFMGVASDTDVVEEYDPA